MNAIASSEQNNPPDLSKVSGVYCEIHAIERITSKIARIEEYVPRFQKLKQENQQLKVKIQHLEEEIENLKVWRDTMLAVVKLAPNSNN
ncbi:hypothetical protein G7B40_001560 [Aetokthonos hydrillicola Thurmond2011]|jgi:predicted RNase H-like nuclease (RuvC/YqgF family)|uniref:Uncharacterized protein n=1 Tax=Aetokthonos hydrillicola Thurmond2011 TaxID=2712845 RepID=A0AAP5I168_9CYAN|nr:hypothetical protein [Aetokthonos hydrillicola]MBO3463570.1 hypothetical protein [Aetokthonos hydrillicola CCALA 1050]MDR9893273.1 hypothetical protein [Aetokthonos hydrillicola Thurmond2011]